MGDPFEEFRDLAFRVEALPFYADSRDGKSQELEYFSSSGTIPEGHNSEWADLVKGAATRGAQVCRLRLVSSPLSPYELFELRVGYTAGRGAGEMIRVAERSFATPDYWLYDGKIIELLHYDEHGYFLGSSIREATPEERLRAAGHMRVFCEALSPESYLEREW